MFIKKIDNESIAGKIIGVAFLLSIALGACKEAEKKSELPEDYLAAFDGDVITKSEVLKAMPGGVNSEDSARFVKSYVTNWIQTRLIGKEAAAEVNMKEIDRLVEEYRRELVMTAYRRKMYEENAGLIPEDTIASYYDEHKSDFILDRPLVKGTYLKVPSDAKNLRVLKRLYKSDKQADIDRLEKEVLSSAIHYDYFRDKWIDWEQIETKIPEDFGKQPDQWLSKNHSLEKNVGGFTYLLYITEVLPSGSPMPIEAARSQIVNRLLNINRTSFDTNLLNNLYQQALSEKRLTLSPALN